MPLPPDATEEEVLSRFKELHATETNPTSRELIAMNIAQLELCMDTIHSGRIPTRKELNRAFAVYDARIETAITRLEKIPLDVWTEWNEMSKEQFIPMFAEIFRNAGRKWEWN